MSHFFEYTIRSMFNADILGNNGYLYAMSPAQLQDFIKIENRNSVGVSAPAVERKDVYQFYTNLDKSENGYWRNTKWLGRKIFAIPKALWYGLFKNIIDLVWTLFQVSFVGFELIKFLKQSGFLIVNNMKMAGGHLLSVCDDQLGRSYIDKANLEKHAEFLRDESTEEELINKYITMHSATYPSNPASFDSLVSFDNPKAVAISQSRFDEEIKKCKDPKNIVVVFQMFEEMCKQPNHSDLMKYYLLHQFFLYIEENLKLVNEKSELEKVLIECHKIVEKLKIEDSAIVNDISISCSKILKNSKTVQHPTVHPFNDHWEKNKEFYKNCSLFIPHPLLTYETVYSELKEAVKNQPVILYRYLICARGLQLGAPEKKNNLIEKIASIDKYIIELAGSIIDYTSLDEENIKKRKFVIKRYEDFAKVHPNQAHKEFIEKRRAIRAFLFNMKSLKLLHPMSATIPPKSVQKKIVAFCNL